MSHPGVSWATAPPGSAAELRRLARRENEFPDRSRKLRFLPGTFPFRRHRPPRPPRWTALKRTSITEPPVLSNDAAQAGRDKDVQLRTEARSRPCLQPDGWAISSCSPTPKMDSQSDEEPRDGCKRKEQEHAPQSLLPRIEAEAKEKISGSVTQGLARRKREPTCNANTDCPSEPPPH